MVEFNSCIAVVDEVPQDGEKFEKFIGFPEQFDY